MSRTPRLVVLAAALIVLAGCNGLTGGDQPSPDTTPEMTPTETTATERPLAAEEFPPGFERSGITNPAALTATNAETLVETGYVSELRITSTLRSQSQTRNVSFRRRERVTKNASSFLFHAEQSQDGQQTQATAWSNGSTTLLRLEQGEQTRYTDIDPDQITSQFAAQQLLAGYLGMGNYSIAAVNRTNGQTRLTLTADQYVNRTREEFPAPVNVSQFSSTVVVDLDGRIHTVTIQLIAERTDNRTLTVAFQYELVQTSDVQIDRPEWVSDARTPTSGIQSRIGFSMAVPSDSAFQAVAE